MEAVHLAEPKTQVANDDKFSVIDGLPNAPDNDFYDIRAVPGKGYGCFAIQDIKRGTRILADSPLVIVPFAEYLQTDIKAAFEPLLESEKGVFFSLASSHGQDPKKWPSKIHPTVTGRELERVKEQHQARVGQEPSLISIFQTNCMEMGKGAAIFPHAARFNHSCGPNANFSWNPTIEKETIHVIKDVKAGEEITLSYCDMTHDKTLRAWELKHYGFDCDCPACTEDEDDPDSFAHRSTDLRFMIAELDRATKMLRGPRLLQGVGDPGVVKKLLELAKLHRELGDYSIRLANIHLELALICEEAHDFENGLKCIAEAIRVKRDCQGVDSPDYEKYKEVLRRIHNKRKTQTAYAS